MKNKKQILTIMLIIMGIILIIYGGINYKNNIKKQSNNESKENDDYDPDSYNEYRDLNGYENDLIITDFTYQNANNICNFDFIITNNRNEKIENKVLKVYFLDKDNNLINTFEYNIGYLGVHNRTEIKYHIEITKEVEHFEYEFDNVKRKIEIKK